MYNYIRFLTISSRSVGLADVVGLNTVLLLGLTVLLLGLTVLLLGLPTLLLGLPTLLLELQLPMLTTYEKYYRQ